MKLGGVFGHVTIEITSQKDGEERSLVSDSQVIFLKTVVKCIGSPMSVLRWS